MENKDMVCPTCLCLGRTLYNIENQLMKKFYLDTLKEIPLHNEFEVCPSICWECTAVLKKVVLFKEQVKDSYRMLQAYTKENLHECLLTPRLQTHHLEPISNIPSDCHEKSYIEISMETSLDEKPDVPPVVKEEARYWSDGLDDILSNNDKSSICTDNITDIEKNIDVLLENSEKKSLKQSLLECGDNISELENELSNLSKKERKKLKIISKEKRKKKKIKLKTKDKLKKPLKVGKGQKILAIEMSYEEMLLEREKESIRESYVNAEYKCESCLIGFNYAKSYETHVSTKHSQELGEYSCPICKTVVATMKSFTTHYKRHMKRYECGLCGKRSADSKVIQQHYYTAHEIHLKQYTCKLCGNISNSIDTHRYHRDSHKARVQCQQCEKTFSHRAGLLNHRLAVHELHNDFPCGVCGKTFRWKTSLKRHLEKHDLKDDVGPPAAVCAQCGISFASVSSYQRHLRNSLKHVSQNQLRFICDDCGRRFADKTKLRDHIEEIHLHKTYQCHICSKPSKNRVGLDQHIRNVHKGRPHNKVCHYCGKAFPTKVQLESHLRSHTGERPFICELCPTAFSQQSNLYKHNRQVHLNIKSKRYPITKKKKEEPAPPPSQYNTQPDYAPDRRFV